MKRALLGDFARVNPIIQHTAPVLRIHQGVNRQDLGEQNTKHYMLKGKI